MVAALIIFSIDIMCTNFVLNSIVKHCKYVLTARQNFQYYIEKSNGDEKSYGSPPMLLEQTVCKRGYGNKF